jgi:hypothetical protein
MQQLAEDFLPLIDDALKGFIPILKIIGKAIEGISWLIAKPLKLIGIFSDSMASGFTKWIEPGSPHKLGEMLIEGFEKSAPAVERALVTPVNRAVEHAKSLMEGGIVTSSISGRPPSKGLSDIAETAGSEIWSAPSYRQDAPESALAINKVVDVINNLRNDLLNGRIVSNVFIDSQQLSMATVRATNFRNGYGVNNPTVS